MKRFDTQIVREDGILQVTTNELRFSDTGHFDMFIKRPADQYEEGCRLGGLEIEFMIGDIHANTCHFARQAGATVTEIIHHARTIAVEWLYQIEN